MENRLENLSEFENILADYRVGGSSQAVLDSARLALLTGATGTGRDTIINHLVESGKFFHLVSDTTRHPRINNGVQEQNGVEYWFRTEQEFLADLKAGKLLEAEIIHRQQASGISIRELAKSAELNKIAITNVDLNIVNIIKAKPNAFAFLVIPPSFDEWMNRIDKRGVLPADEKKRRLNTAVQIFEASLGWDFLTFVINDKLEDAVDQIYQRCLSGDVDLQKQKLGKEVTLELIAKTKEVL